ncbi:XrtA system polysaccharide chain length determinant [Novosphingobium lentum]|uniref:XrtA system polysaccharide chain length determinant n=1 Tax=Novosphingobium lentum TaxID=145287 RepID=UPI0008345987|nr:XrtA system polysaccharide chain length determinant [Novosphingobium lentum]
MSTIYEEVRIALHGIWQRRWLAIAVAWLVCMLGWLAVAMVPNSYESKARIFVQLDDVLAEQIGIGAGDRRRDIDRVRQTLTSSVNLEKVVRGTRLGDQVTTDKQMEAMVIDVGKAIKVVSQQDNLFEISAQSSGGGLSDLQNAKLAQDIVQKMIDIFREENLAGGRGEMTNTLTFMDQQLADRQKDLEAAEQKRQAFEAKNADMMPGTGSLSSRLESARSELRSVDSDLLAAQSALASIGGQLSGTPQTIAVAGAAGGARGALAQIQSDLSTARARGLTDDHPDVIALKNQIAALTRQVAAEGPHTVSGTPNPAYSSLESIKADRAASVVSLQSRKASLQGEIADLDGKQYSQPGLAAEAARINRDYDVLKEGYDKMLRDREALRLRGQVENERDGVKFEVIDPPSTPRAPIAPDRPVLLTLVLIIGLGAGGGAAFAMGQMRSTFATTGTLERATGLPVLGSISQSLTRAVRAQRLRQLKWFAGAMAGLVAVFVLLLAVEFMKRGMVA